MVLSGCCLVFGWWCCLLFCCGCNYSCSLGYHLVLIVVFICCWLGWVAVGCCVFWGFW